MGLTTSPHGGGDCAIGSRGGSGDSGRLIAAAAKRVRPFNFITLVFTSSYVWSSCCNASSGSLIVAAVVVIVAAAKIWQALLSSTLVFTSSYNE